MHICQFSFLKGEKDISRVGHCPGTPDAPGSSTSGPKPAPATPKRSVNRAAAKVFEFVLPGIPSSPTRFSLDIKTRGLCHRFLNDVHLVRIPLNGAPLAQRSNRHLAGDG